MSSTKAQASRTASGRILYGPLTFAVRLARYWERFQVELHGMLSTQRIQTMGEYYRRTSWLRVMLLTLGTPLPGLITITLLDLLPLASTLDTSNHNYIYWIRTVFAVTVMALGIVQQFCCCLTGLSMRRWQLVGVALTGSTAGFCFVYGLSQVIGFPVPFNLVVQSVTAVPGLVLSLRAVWRQAFRVNPALQTDLRNHLFVFAGEMAMTYVYALYFFAFTSMTSMGQSVFTFGLPMIKIGLKNYLSRALRDSDDVKPAFMVFNVDVFGALYVANCLQSSQSWVNTILIMLVDIAQIAASFRDIRIVKNQIRSLVRLDESSPSLFDYYATAAVQFSTGSRKEASGKPLMVAPSRASSCGPTSGSIPPAATALGKVGREEVDSSLELTDRFRLASAIAKVLFMAECLLLVEFTEVIIPIIYGAYLVMMSYLPNRTYYPQLTSLDAQQLTDSITRVIVNAGLELLSFIFVCWALRREIKLSSMSLLAFVLESQAKLVQSSLVLWFLYLVHQSLVHSGVDFTLRFAWLHST